MSSACTISSSSVVRRCISLSTSNGTLVVHLQWNVGVFCYLHRQWYVDVYLFNTFSGTLVCVIVSGTAVHLFHRQWYVDESFLFYIISGTVVYLFNTFSGTLVCVIVSGTAVHLFHRQWYVDELHLLISSMVR